MPAEEITNRPENHALASFTSHEQAVEAKEALIGKGLTNAEVMQGENSAENMNTRAQWFADTDDELRRFENKLREGYSILAVEVHDKPMRQVVDEVLQQYNAEMVTHFGKWVTETKNV
jgi:hypothetical protein